MNKIIHGEALHEMDKLIKQGIKVDAIITDPPYGTTACKWDSVIPFSPMWERLNKLIKPNGAIALFGSEPFSSYLRMSNIKNYKYDWYWNKGQGLNFVTAKYRPLNDTECISIFGYTINYFPIMTDAKKENIRPINKGSSPSQIQGSIKIAKSADNYNESKRFPVTSININSRIAECNSLNRIHPTQKPVKLLEYLIRTYTLEGETVLDFTCGSGTTGVACIETNRNYILIEQENKYIDITKNRIEEAKKEFKYNLFNEVKC